MDNQIHNSRSNFDKLGSNYKAAENIEIEKEIIEAITCYWFYKKNTKPGDKVVLYLHGGCFVLGSIDSHKALVSHLAKEIDIPILFIEYSLAPEHPFPKAINDILKVYNYVVANIGIHNVSFIGDSAGAGLATKIVSILNKQNNKLNLKTS